MRGDGSKDSFRFYYAPLILMFDVFSLDWEFSSYLPFSFLGWSTQKLVFVTKCHGSHSFIFIFRLLVEQSDAGVWTETY